MRTFQCFLLYFLFVSPIDGFLRFSINEPDEHIEEQKFSDDTPFPALNIKLTNGADFLQTERDRPTNSNLPKSQFLTRKPVTYDPTKTSSIKSVNNINFIQTERDKTNKPNFPRWEHLTRKPVTYNPTKTPSIKLKNAINFIQTERDGPTNSNFPRSELLTRKPITNHPTRKPSIYTIKPQNNAHLQYDSINSVQPLVSLQTQPNASWMSRYHGLSYTMAGGFNYITVNYDVAAFVEQMAMLYTYGVRWFVLNLSSMYFGDRYLSPHSVLTNMNRGSTPKKPEDGWIGGDVPLEEYEDLDLFGEILDGLDSIGVRVIAYMSAQGPALLQSGEDKAYDYNSMSPYVDSCARCPFLTNTLAPFCECAPSVWQWKRYVNTQYNAMDEDTLKIAYAEKIVGEYASRYGEKVAGYAFDQVLKADIPKIHDVVKTYNAKAVMTFNQGQQMPLTNNNPPYEDFTFGLPNFGGIMAYHCHNYPAVTSLESTTDGYFYENGKGSLGHVHSPLNRGWSYGHPVWDVTRAQEWKSRVLNSGGAWTWNVKRARVGAISMIDGEDIASLKIIYEGLLDGPPYVETCGKPRITPIPTTFIRPSQAPTETNTTPAPTPANPSVLSMPTYAPSFRPSTKKTKQTSSKPSQALPETNPTPEPTVYYYYQQDDDYVFSSVPTLAPTPANPSVLSMPTSAPSFRPSTKQTKQTSSKPSQALPKTNPTPEPTVYDNYPQDDYVFSSMPTPANPSVLSTPTSAPSFRPSTKQTKQTSSKPSQAPPETNPTPEPTVYYYYQQDDDYVFSSMPTPANPSVLSMPTSAPSFRPSTKKTKQTSSKPSQAQTETNPTPEPTVYDYYPRDDDYVFTSVPYPSTPTSLPSSTPFVPSKSPTMTYIRNSAWMSEHHGISLRIAAGVNHVSSYFETNTFINQVNELLEISARGIRWVIVNLSGYHGDRYLSPHSVLTSLNIGSTPKAISRREWKNRNMTLEQYDDRDFFGEILDGLDSIGIKVIAYMAAQGPAMLGSGEEKAYDYKNSSPYIDSCALCPRLIGVKFSFCDCAPSVWQWKNYVFNKYNATGDNTLKKAYAEIIVGEYALKYGSKLAGFVFDQAHHLHRNNKKHLYEVIRSHNSEAVIAFNIGQRIPLKNNNAPYEDFTFGYLKPLHNVAAADCQNYPAITSIEHTSDGFFYEGGKGSLGHIHTPINRKIEGGRSVWSTEQAQEWQSSVLAAKGAWTWAVQVENMGGRIKIQDNDIVFLENVYTSLQNNSLYQNSDLYRSSCKQSQAPSVNIAQNIIPTNTPSSNPTTSGTINNTNVYSPSSTFPTGIPSREPSITSSLMRQTAKWMSGYHGISFRISCGVSYISSFYDVDGFIKQFKDNLLNYGVKWVIINLSSSFHGDRYLSPHSVLTIMNRGSTPKVIPKGEWKNNIDMPLDQYDDRDLFGEILHGLDSIGVRVIAYMAAQGPAMLLSGEQNGYDYENNSPYVDSCALCPSLTNTQAPFCACAPSVWKWKKMISERYNGVTLSIVRKAYAEIIVSEYASKYGKKLAGFVFDQATRALADMSMLYRVTRAYNPVAALSFANGHRMPLQMKNYPYEDFTFGYPKNVGRNESSSCENYAAITSVESAKSGFFNLNGKSSLGHFHTPIHKSWINGNMVWTVEQAQEWQSRMMNAKGAWTWGVTRGIGKHFSLLSLYDLEFLKRVYDGLRDGPPYVSTCEEGNISRMP